MKLIDIMKQIKDVFYVEDELRVYIYKDSIEFIDYMEVEGLKPIYGNLVSLNYKDNIITCIAHDSLILMNKTNIHIYQTLINLIGQHIDDLDDFAKLENEDQNITQISMYQKL